MLPPSCMYVRRFAAIEQLNVSFAVELGCLQLLNSGMCSPAYKCAQTLVLHQVQCIMGRHIIVALWPIRFTSVICHDQSINQSIQFKVCLRSSTDPSDCVVGIMIRLLANCSKLLATDLRNGAHWATKQPVDSTQSGATSSYGYWYC